MLEVLIKAGLFIFIAIMNAVFAQKLAYSENKTTHNGQTALLGGFFPLSKNEDINVAAYKQVP